MPAPTALSPKANAVEWSANYLVPAAAIALAPILAARFAVNNSVEEKRKKLFEREPVFDDLEKSASAEKSADARWYDPLTKPTTALAAATAIVGAMALPVLAKKRQAALVDENIEDEEAIARKRFKKALKLEREAAGKTAEIDSNRVVGSIVAGGAISAAIALYNYNKNRAEAEEDSFDEEYQALKKKSSRQKKAFWPAVGAMIGKNLWWAVPTAAAGYSYANTPTREQREEIAKKELEVPKVNDNPTASKVTVEGLAPYLALAGVALAVPMMFNDSAKKRSKKMFKAVKDEINQNIPSERLKLASGTIEPAITGATSPLGIPSKYTKAILYPAIALSILGGAYSFVDAYQRNTTVKDKEKALKNKMHQLKAQMGQINPY